MSGVLDNLDDFRAKLDDYSLQVKLFPEKIATFSRFPISLSILVLPNAPHGTTEFKWITLS